MQVKRQAFYQPEEILHEAEFKLKQLNDVNKEADYFSFVPDGEPTLDINLGKIIRLLKPYGVKIAVITNASILWMDDVKEDLIDADWVSVSIDAVDEKTWHIIDRPHGSLRHQDILNGIIEFSKVFKGSLVTETMFVQDMNDSDEQIGKIAKQIALIDPQKSYFLVPTRPPAESSIKRSAVGRLKKAVAITRGISGTDVECITGDEEEEGFFFSDDIAEDILSIASVHPIREEIIRKLIDRRNAHFEIVTELLDRGDLVKYNFEGKSFYRRYD